MAPFTQGDAVWIAIPEGQDPSTTEAFLPGTFDAVKDELVSIKLLQGDVRQVSPDEVRQRFADSESATYADNTSLVHLNDASILLNLRRRHAQDKIYTYTASVLLAVNPYKQINGLYDEAHCEQYRGKHLGAMPPHPFAIADTAYRALVREQRNQALLISGESGAGKTETAKIVMKYLGFASGATCDRAGRMQARVLQAQPILESFGNAVTLRNSNSSRFGKYNRLFFDASGMVVDSAITTYLLESSRVVVHGEGERTYHVFYEMLAGLDDATLETLALKRDGQYQLLHNVEDKPQGGATERDARNFTRLREAMNTVGVTTEEIDAILGVLAGLVHLGDVPLAGEAYEKCLEAMREDEHAFVEVNEESIDLAAKFLGMDADDLRLSLRVKSIQVKGRNSILRAPRTDAQFRQALHSLIKAIYKRLFEHTVKQINKSFNDFRPDTAEFDAWRHIGILDIYGFERLKRNSFEQLCINLANERLQQYFVENVLDAEQGLYLREGLPWKGLTLPDSTPVVNCISNIFKSLDDFSSRLAKNQPTSDERFCEAVLTESMKDPCFKDLVSKPKVRNRRGSTAAEPPEPTFVVKHYAGQVQYNSLGWLDKNNDRLLQDCEDLICESENDLVKSLSDVDSQKGSAFRSISKKYVTDLEALLQTLGTSDGHYIRCFKPNERQQPNNFNARLVLDQIVQCGTIELVKIMHDGFPNRCPFDDIVSRFRAMLPEKFQRYGTRTFIEALMLAYDVPKDEWSLGVSRLFLKAGRLKSLEDMRSDGVAPDPSKLEEIVSGIIRKRWRRAYNAHRFCQHLRAEKAARWLCVISQKIGRFRRILLDVRQAAADRRLKARRRFLGFLKAKRAWKELLLEIRERHERAYQSWRHALLITVGLSRWIQLGKKAAAQAAIDKQEAEKRRLLADQQRLADEKRRFQEEQEERKRLEAEEAKRKAEEQAQREEERRQKEEIEKKERLEQDAKRREEEKLRLEAETAKLEELARTHAEEIRVRMQEERERMEEERRRFEEERVEFERKKQQEQLILHQASPQLCRTSNAGSSAAEGEEKAEVEAEVEAMVKEQVNMARQEIDKQQEVVLKQLEELKERNRRLERQLEEERAAKGSQPPGDSPLQLSPPAPSTPAGGFRRPRHSEMHSRQIDASGCGISPLSLNSSVLSAGHSRSKRASIAVEALQNELTSSESRRMLAGSPGSAPPGCETIMSKRKWWAQQREYLLDELYPKDGMPPVQKRQTPTSARGSTHGSANATMGPPEESSGSTQEVRSLSAQFEQEEPQEATAPTLTRKMLKEASMQSTRLKQPKTYLWRRSVGGYEP